MELTIYQVDAFAEKAFEGNPAAVIPLQEWLPDEMLQAIAMENQLSETAYFLPSEKGLELRWFTPTTEVDLCGHATLATAHVLFTEFGDRLAIGNQIPFQTRSGELRVQQVEGRYAMDFPADPPLPEDEGRDRIEEALGNPVVDLLRGRHDLVAILESEKEVAELDPDIRAIGLLPARGILVSAPGDQFDFVSRCFFPQSGIDEDPVTGSAHTTLAPYWAGKLEKSNLNARQISRRGGNVICLWEGERVVLVGGAVTFIRGTIQI